MAIDAVLLVKLELKESDGTPVTIRLTSAPFDVNYGGYTWLATGDLLSVGEYEKNYELITEGIKIQLSGINEAYQTYIEQQGFLNAPVDVMLATIADDSNDIDTAVYYHRGFANTPVTEYDEASGTITVAMETQSVFKNLDDMSSLMSCSLGHHNTLHKGDKFFEYTANVNLKEETWKN